MVPVQRSVSGAWWSAFCYCGSLLFSCDWISALQLNLRPVTLVEAFTSLQQVLYKHCDVFKEGLGELRNAKAKIFISLHECPRFFTAHPVTFALHQRVEETLKCLQAMVVIHPVKFSDWAAPIVPIEKKDGCMHINGDYNLTVNHIAKQDKYRLPRIKELHHWLGASHF